MTVCVGSYVLGAMTFAAGVGLYYVLVAVL